MNRSSGDSGPAEWVGQPGHAPVVFEIFTIFMGFCRRKIEKLGGKLTKKEKSKELWTKCQCSMYKNVVFTLRSLIFPHNFKYCVFNQRYYCPGGFENVVLLRIAPVTLKTFRRAC